MRTGHTQLSDIDRQLGELRQQISDAAQQADGYRAKTAAALGGGVFLLLLAIGACYEILAGNPSVWATIGVTGDGFYILAAVLVVSSLGLLILAWSRERRRDRAREAWLDGLEQEFAELMERKKAADARQ
ncbi:MAG TPA: hypothetical protein VNO14_02660 [Blastocatellia bacterium]|nr:hypothetical protein [Blastocatellia bacterium]